VVARQLRRYRHGPWIGPRWGMSLQMDVRYEREVALLIRDRADGKPLFEARASNEGSSAQAGAATLAAMFEACLVDFPRAVVGVLTHNPARRCGCGPAQRISLSGAGHTHTAAARTSQLTAGAASARRSSSQPLSRSRAFWRWPPWWRCGCAPRSRSCTRSA
jgi:hypothetical protein